MMGPGIVPAAGERRLYDSHGHVLLDVCTEIIHRCQNLLYLHSATLSSCLNTEFKLVRKDNIAATINVPTTN